MNKFKIILALVLVLALGTMSVACLDDGKQSSNEGSGQATNDPATFDPSSVASAGDRDAIALTLGDLAFTAGDVEDMYDDYVYYLTQYGMSEPTTDEDIASTLDIALQEIVSSNALIWQAGLQGIELSEDELAEVDAAVNTHETDLIDAYREDILSSATEELTDAELEQQVMEAIETDVMANVGCTFGDYLELYRDYCTEDAINAKVEKVFIDAYEVADSDVADWYNTTLEAQRSSFEEDALAYRTQANAYYTDPSAVPALFTPDGFVRVQLIEIKPEGTLEDSYTANKTSMTALEAEYGKLALTGSNPDRLAAIEAEYATLKAAVDATYALYIKDAKTAAQEAYAKLQAGEDFVSVMNEYSTAEADTQMQEKGTLLYTLASDSAFASEVWGAAAAMPVGTNSTIIEVDGAFYIVKVLSLETAGSMDLAANKDAITAAARAELGDAAWTDQVSAWTQEAMDIAVYYPETYAYVGH